MANKRKKALIIGVNGQDGKILFNFLSRLNYGIIGIDKDAVKTHNLIWRKKINIYKKNEVEQIIRTVRPDEIYYLAAWHHSSQDKQQDLYNELCKSYQINVFSFINFLESIRLHSQKTKIFYASSSLIFGDCENKSQTEKTPYHPNSAYGLTKMDGTILCHLYRKKYGLFASSGILYNHESEHRAENFISMKIIKGALKIKNKKQNKLLIGNLSSLVDWGYAPDYIEAMHKILNTPKANDFIIATGKLHSVLDFIKIAFGHLSLDWKKYVKEDKKIVAKERPTLAGNYAKLKNATGWKPTTNFPNMIKKIINIINQKK